MIIHRPNRNTHTHPKIIQHFKCLNKNSKYIAYITLIVFLWCCLLSCASNIYINLQRILIAQLNCYEETLAQYHVNCHSSSQTLRIVGEKLIVIFSHVWPLFFLAEEIVNMYLSIYVKVSRCLHSINNV